MIYNIQTGGTPIYRQIVERISHQVASGRLTLGQSVPSVRELAKLLAVNPMTISKAYTMLVEDGVLSRLRGGCLYVVGEEISEKLRYLLLKPHVEHVLEIATDLGLNRQAIVKLIDSEFDILPALKGGDSKLNKLSFQIPKTFR